MDSHCPVLDSALRPLHAAALATVRNGWPVFPVRPGSKIPAIAGWEDNATHDPDQLADWWSRRPYNVGIACGPAGLVVVDIDLAGRGDLSVAWLEHLDDLDLEPFLECRGQVTTTPWATALTAARTRAVTTPNGGRHLYFTAPAGTDMRNTVSRLGQRIDTRAHGGYVLAPGSVRRTPRDRRRYRLVDDSPATTLPAEIAHALSPTPPRQMDAAPIVHPDAYVRAVLDGETAAVRTAAVGTRNHRLFRAAARLGDLVAAGRLTETAAHDALHAACHTHIGVDGFTTAEARRCIDNGIDRARRGPGPDPSGASDRIPA